MLYKLILIICFSGQCEIHVVDHGLSYKDCSLYAQATEKHLFAPIEITTQFTCTEED